MTIEVIPVKKWYYDSEIKLAPAVTAYGVFNPPDGRESEFAELAGTLFSLYLSRGRTVRELCEELNDSKSYLYEFGPKNLMKDLNQLYLKGAIDLKGDRIVLRTEAPGPLELLARCATE